MPSCSINPLRLNIVAVLTWRSSQLVWIDTFFLCHVYVLFHGLLNPSEDSLVVPAFDK